MENKGVYEVDSDTIRPGTLRPYVEWERPNGGEIRAMMRRLQLTGSGLASLVGVANQGSVTGGGSRTVRRWTGGETDIPYAVWCIMAYEAGYGCIWKNLEA